MQLKAVFDYRTNRLYEEEQLNENSLSELIQFAMWSSEPVPFDPMEKTLHKVYEETQKEDKRQAFSMIHEYPLEGNTNIRWRESHQ